MTLREHTGPVWSVAFSPDGASVATGSFDGTLQVCDSYTGARRRLFSTHPSPVNAVTYSSTGMFVVSGSKDGCPGAAESSDRDWFMRQTRNTST